jgi:multidrug efflux pump subunit AcrA (membrane-fusion protein)
VQTGLTAELDVEAYPHDQFTGTVSRVNRTVERTSRTFMVEVVVPNADRRLSAGSFVKAAVVTKVDDRARTVPEESLVRFAGVTKVFVLDGSKVREVPVIVGPPVVVTEGGRSRTWIEVDGDLKAGTQVVTSGQTRLADGVAARVR